jgi:hypothetical protein
LKLTGKRKLGGIPITKDVPHLAVDHISTKSSLLGVWHGKRSKAISTGNKRRIVPHLLSFLILPRFRGNPFYVVQRYETIAIPDVDCHKDLHCSVQKIYSSKSKVINCEQTGIPSVWLPYFDHDSSLMHRHL